MKRRLSLTGPDDRVLYRQLLVGFLAGSLEGDKSKEQIYQLSRIKKTLFAAGELLTVPTTPHDPDLLRALSDPTVLVFRPGQAIRLKDGEQTITLDQHDWDLVEKRCVASGVSALDADIMAECFDRLSLAEVIRD